MHYYYENLAFSAAYISLPFHLQQSLTVQVFMNGPVFLDIRTLALYEK